VEKSKTGTKANEMKKHIFSEVNNYLFSISEPVFCPVN